MRGPFTRGGPARQRAVDRQRLPPRRLQPLHARVSREPDAHHHDEHAEAAPGEREGTSEVPRRSNSEPALSRPGDYRLIGVGAHGEPLLPEHTTCGRPRAKRSTASPVQRRLRAQRLQPPARSVHSGWNEKGAAPGQLTRGPFSPGGDPARLRAPRSSGAWSRGTWRDLRTRAPRGRDALRIRGFLKPDDQRTGRLIDLCCVDEPTTRVQ